MNPLTYNKQLYQEEYKLNNFRVIMNFDGYGMSTIYVDERKYLGEFDTYSAFNHNDEKRGILFSKEFKNYFKGKKIKDKHLMCAIYQRNKGTAEKMIGYILLWLDTPSDIIPISISVTLNSIGLKRFIMIEFPHKFNKMNMEGNFKRKRPFEFKKNKYNGRFQD